MATAMQAESPPGGLHRFQCGIRPFLKIKLSSFNLWEKRDSCNRIKDFQLFTVDTYFKENSLF